MTTRRPGGEPIARQTSTTSGRSFRATRGRLARHGAALAVILALLSCGEGVTPPPPPPPAPAPQPATVTLEPNPAVVVAADTVRLVARVLDERARVISGAPVTWTSGDPAVATVDATGLVTGLKEGRASVTATSGPATASAPLTVRSQDRATLIDVYDAAGGGSWTGKDSWTTDAPLGSWFGVEANPDGRVLTLHLSENGLRGQLPRNLGDLALLTELRMDGNALTGPLPLSLARLGLRELHYAGTMLCTPSDEAFREWLNAIPSRDGPYLECNEERADLAKLYEAMGGPNWINSTNWLSDQPLENWYGLLVDEAGRVTGINLIDNRLAGQIPPEIARFPRLRFLGLDLNRLTGQIPVELGALPELGLLGLAGNDLRGHIPPELGNATRLVQVSLNDNQLNGTVPPELGNLAYLRQLYLNNNLLEGSIPRELGALSDLQLLRLSSNLLEGAVPPELGELGSLQWLDLGGNDLSGPLPAELGQLDRLQALWLGDNMFSGSVPPAFGDLRALEQLHLQNNEELSGPLPESLTSVGLEELLAGGTALCVPDQPAFRTWGEAILKRRIRPCRAEGQSDAYLTQAVQSRDYPVPLVAGESALLRVFITSGEETSAAIPPVRATFFVDGVETHVVEIAAGSSPIPTEVEEGELDLSANAEIHGAVIQPGLEMVIEIDPGGTLDPGLGVAKRIPETGRAPIDVRAMPTLRLTLIPFIWTGNNDPAAVTLVSEIHPNHEILWQTNNLLPVGAFAITKHQSVTIASNSAFAVLNEVGRIRAIEGGTGHWKGLLPEPEGAGGVAYIGGKVSMSQLSESTIAHELGHNFNLRHADCGSAAGPDPTFPWPNGAIGAWGYDPRDGASLVPPDWADLMSYCPPEWISDYYFTNSLRYRLVDEGAASRVPAAATRSLLVSGRATADGVPSLDPAFVIDASPVVPRSGGPYELTGRRVDGSELFSLSFNMPEIADGDGRSGFTFALPVRAEWEAELASLSLSGPGGTVEMREGSEPPLAILRDPRTGQVRAILRDLPADALARSDLDALAPAPGLEAMISSGLPDAAAWRR
ncbi:Ig-like domain-containing protein [Candidatus Palauibacter sp.]|uniref:Ig-like domain-containing protein n=1 Tax=Candidatus Palauibacter sp. TaxID=3101350 RepID=UPI003AF1FF8A